MHVNFTLILIIAKRLLQQLSIIYNSVQRKTIIRNNKSTINLSTPQSLELLLINLSLTVMNLIILVFSPMAFGEFFYDHKIALTSFNILS